MNTEQEDRMLKQVITELEQEKTELTKDGESFPLSLSQQDIYFDQLHYPDSPRYNIGGYITLGRVDVDRLSEAHRYVISNHDAFGIRIVFVDQQVEQRVVFDRTTSLPFIDFSQHDAPENSADNWLTRLFEMAINIENCELFKAYLFKLSGFSYRYVFFSHHLIMDGWGFSNWVRAICDHYHSGNGSVNQKSCWRNSVSKDLAYLVSNKYKSDRAYWRKVFEVTPHKMLTPHNSHDLKQKPNTSSARYVFKIGASKYAELLSFLEETNLRTPQVLLGVLSVYFGRTYKKSKLVFGMPFHNRRTFDEKQMIGLFASVSPIHVDFDERLSFQELVHRIARSQKHNFRYVRYPIGHLIRDLGLKGKTEALYDVGFNFLKLDTNLQIEGKVVEFVSLSHNHETTPLLITACENHTRKSLEIQFDYNHTYFDHSEIPLLERRLRYLLDSLLKHSNKPLSSLDLIPISEINQLNHMLTGPQIEYSKKLCIHHIFEERVKDSPSAPAVLFQTQQITYGQLNQRANRLAHKLIKKGVTPNILVGVYVDQSIDMIVAILAILKAGGAFVPIDPKYPEARIKSILIDSGITTVLTQAKLTSQLPFEATQVLWLDADNSECYPDVNPQQAQVKVSPQNLAYVIYTSGTTGKPKGVMVEHCNLVSHCNAMSKYYEMRAGDRVLQLASIGTDTAFEQLFGAWKAGSTMVIPEEKIMTSEAFYSFCSTMQITLADLPPAYLHELLADTSVARQYWERTSITRLILGGEALNPRIIQTWLNWNIFERCQVINAYGPTEATITASAHKITIENAAEKVTIGKAMAGRTFYIFDQNLNHVPIGIAGELYIGGSLARGYLNQPELTHAKFIKNPNKRDPNTRLYKTGDLVRLQTSGNLEFIGRTDEQVKIRGFRIELNEIEAQLSRLPHVLTSAVIAHEYEQGSNRLIAYVIKENGPPPAVKNGNGFIGSLKQHLQAELPSYMIPSDIVVLDRFPLSPNGKIDKRALPIPDRTLDDLKYEAPTSETELKLAKIWSELLKIDIEKISIAANFFDMGGNSLLVVRLTTEIKEKLKKIITVADVFSHSSLEDLAKLIQGKSSVQSSNSYGANPFYSIVELFTRHNILAGQIAYFGNNFCHSMAYGIACEQRNLPTDEKSMFRLGCNTKVLTALIILQLVSAKKLALNQRIGELPFLSQYRNALGPITIQDLLAHSSGLDMSPSVLDHDYTLGEAVAVSLEGMECQFSPGAKYGYSMFGFSFLGFIAEQILGQNYIAILKDNLFSPLNLELVCLRESNAAQNSYPVKEGWIDSSVPGHTEKMSEAMYSRECLLPSGDESLYVSSFALAKILHTLLNSPHLLNIRQDLVGMIFKEYQIPINHAFTAAVGFGIFKFSNGIWGHIGNGNGHHSLIGILLEKKEVFVIQTNKQSSFALFEEAMTMLTGKNLVVNNPVKYRNEPTGFYQNQVLKAWVERSEDPGYDLLLKVEAWYFGSQYKKSYHLRLISEDCDVYLVDKNDDVVRGMVSFYECDGLRYARITEMPLKEMVGPVLCPSNKL